MDHVNGVGRVAEEDNGSPSQDPFDERVTERNASNKNHQSQHTQSVWYLANKENNRKRQNRYNVEVPRWIYPLDETVNQHTNRKFHADLNERRDTEKTLSNPDVLRNEKLKRDKPAQNQSNRKSYVLRMKHQECDGRKR